MPFYPPHRVPTPRNRRFRAAVRTVDRAVYSIIAGRRRDGGDEEDLLALLIGTPDEPTGEAMGDKQLRDEVMTLFLAGHETTANALSWALYLISTHPHVERRRVPQGVPSALILALPETFLAGSSGRNSSACLCNAFRNGSVTVEG